MKGAKPVTVAEVARELRLDKSAALHRVRRAEALGYLANLEKRKGYPAQLILGDLLPEDEPEILPRPDDARLRS